MYLTELFNLQLHSWHAFFSLYTDTAVSEIRFRITRKLVLVTCPQINALHIRYIYSIFK